MQEKRGTQWPAGGRIGAWWPVGERSAAWRWERGAAAVKKSGVRWPARGRSGAWQLRDRPSCLSLSHIVKRCGGKGMNHSRVGHTIFCFLRLMGGSRIFCLISFVFNFAPLFFFGSNCHVNAALMLRGPWSKEPRRCHVSQNWGQCCRGTLFAWFYKFGDVLYLVFRTKDEIQTTQQMEGPGVNLCRSWNQLSLYRVTVACSGHRAN